MDPVDRAWANALQRTGRFVTRHPRQISAAVVIALAGFAATAFGIAPLAPDAADLPSRIVTENVTPEGIDAQLEALAEHELELYRSDLTRSSDTADSLLRRLNLDDAAAAAFIRSDPTARKLLAGRAGKMVQVRADASGELDELVARYAPELTTQYGTHFTRLRIARVDGVLQATLETAPLAAQVRLGSGTIRNSLFAATDEARIPDPVASQIAEVFATDVDFHRELRRGDSFRVIYEALTADGEPITWNQSSGRVLAAEFSNNGKTYSAVWFKDPATGRGGYFDLAGQSKRRSFLASPMEFSRVTSGFAMRLHPILQTWRQHNGVDYGAPTGTPVRTVGDGTVDFAGWQNGYGNVVSIKHSNDRSTVYAHLSRVDVRRGQRIEQGTRIGAVGATGWATGPHLHFEVKVRGQQQNPLLIAKSSETIAISPTAKAQFGQLAQGVKAQLEAAETMARVGSYAE
ncbi:MAG TPA: peptidoglycan DD-metalloendopeptidase family protein [Albitalea sp.]|nr:peptidoglycan DD-metalloendopeptidase family protein [Albitalea sp.]